MSECGLLLLGWKKDRIDMNRGSNKSKNNLEVGSMQGYIKSERLNRNEINRTHYSGMKNLNLFTLEYIHNDWSREKKTKLGFQGGDTSLLRLKARKSNKNAGNK